MTVMVRIARLPAVIGLILCVAAPAAVPGPAGAAEKVSVMAVPPGNRSAKQPEISYSSYKRTSDTGGTFDGKYQQVYAWLARDKDLIARIKKAAAIYDVDPIHVIGAIVGEHTYNVDVIDSLQGYYVKALEYFKTRGLSFSYHGIPIEEFVAKPQFAACDKDTESYELWSCREDVWRSTFQGKTVDGVDYPDERFGRVFFQPLFAGQTFGIGQLNPLTALMVSDLVHERSGLPALDMRNAPEIYRAVMDPDLSLQYIAAVIRFEIDTYRSVAGFDISTNPGITATLYNVGDVVDRARKLKAENQGRRAQGLAVTYPKENYYGWLVNDRLDELKKLL
jgi:hypothetical protein